MHHFVVSTSQFVVFLSSLHNFTMLLLSLIIAVLGFIMTFVLHSQLSSLVYHYVLFPLPFGFTFLLHCHVVNKFHKFLLLQNFMSSLATQRIRDDYNRQTHQGSCCFACLYNLIANMLLWTLSVTNAISASGCALQK